MRKPTYSEEQKNKHIVQGVFVFCVLFIFEFIILF